MTIETRFDLDDKVVIAPSNPNFHKDTYDEVGFVNRINTVHGTRGGHGDGTRYLLKFIDPRPGDEMLWIDEEDLMSEGEFEAVRDAAYEERSVPSMTAADFQADRDERLLWGGAMPFAELNSFLECLTSGRQK